MKVYSFSEARQRFAEVLQQAKREGEVHVRRRDGQVFRVQPVQTAGSPLDVPAVESHLTAAQIVHLVRESQESAVRPLAAQPAGKRSRQAVRVARKSRR